MAEEQLSFKEMCAKFDVTPRTLALLRIHRAALARTARGGSRFYGPREVARMTLIMRGRRFGFSLEEVRQWLQIYDEQGTEAQMRTWVDAADRQLEKLDAADRRARRGARRTRSRCATRWRRNLGLSRRPNRPDLTSAATTQRHIRRSTPRLDVDVNVKRVHLFMCITAPEQWATPGRDEQV